MAAGAYLMGWDSAASGWVKVVATASGALTTAGGASGGGDASAANQTTMITSLQLLDDVVATDGSAALTKLYQVGGTDGANAQILSTNSTGHLNIADGGNSITVDAPVGTPAFVRLSDGASPISTLPVSLASVPSHPVTNAGTFAVQVDGAALTALQLIDDAILTDDAAFTVGTTKVAMKGAYAVAHGANPDAADAGDAGATLMNRHRIPFNIGGHPNTITRTAYISDAAGAQTDASIVGTINAGTKVVVTSATVTVDYQTTGPNGSGVAVKLGFGASTLPADSATGANGILIDHKGVPGGGGVVLGNGGAIIGVGGDGEELRLTCEDPINGGLSVTVTYFTIES